MKTFKDFSFKELENIYKNLIFKYDKNMGYIESVFKEKDTIYFNIIINGEELISTVASAEICIKEMEHISIEEIETEKYLDFISKLEDIVESKEFCVYAK